MRDQYKYNSSEMPSGLTGFVGDGPKSINEPRIPMALHRLEGQCEYLHQNMGVLFDRLHPACRPSAPEVGCGEKRMEPACDMEAFIGRLTDALENENARMASLLNRLEL